MEVKQKQYVSQTKDLDQKGRVRIAVNAFGNTDSDNDISMPGSFKKTLNENFGRVRWFLNHDTTQLLGVPVKGWEEKDFLVMEAQFNLEKQIGRDTYEDYKLYQEHGKTLEHSIGVQAIKYDIDNNTGLRKIHEWKLWEFSTLTSWGANENTPLLGIKSLSDLQEVLTRMGDNSRYSDERKKTIEKTQKALLLEPSRYTPDQKAAIKYIINGFDFNNLI